MEISRVYIENFRGYENRISIEFGELTAFIGKNDVGKSTILEALDIFFNNGKNLCKLDKEDIHISKKSEITVIGVCFKNFPEKLVVDAAVETSLQSEYLLNNHGELEIQKVYKNGNTTAKDIYIMANFPKNTVCRDLHSKSVAELKSLIDELQLDVTDRRTSSVMRKAIFESLTGNIDFEEKSISANKEGGKHFWKQIENYFPIYELFQSDRKNIDQDNEIQNPMKVLIKEILSDSSIREQLDDIYDKIVSESQKLANQTIEKLAEMNSEIAEELNAEFEQPAWDKIFKFKLDSDDGIAVNKRGSGVRRLILLNFFRAEAERRSQERNVPNVIYAFEEPETSQHPEHQEMLIKSLLELSKSGVNQIILTTHSPSIAQLLPIETLRLIQKNEQSPSIRSFIEEPEILDEIANSLGVLPNIPVHNTTQVRMAVCVEGKNDINFLNNINNTIPELKQIIDISSNAVILLPMGGSTLQFWVNGDYLRKLGIHQLHIYDSDNGSSASHKYKSWIDIINDRPNSKGFETTLRELENYITPEIVKKNVPGLVINEEIIEKWGTCDVPELIASYNHKNDPQSIGDWESLDDKKKKNKVGKIKNRINEEYVKDLSKEILERHGYYNEIEGWFIQVAKFCEDQFVPS